MVAFYVDRIKKGIMVVADVSGRWKEKVEAELQK